METTRDASRSSGEPVEGQRAEDLFPDFFPKAAVVEQECRETVLPPLDAGWEERETQVSREETGLHALVLLQDAEQRRLVERTLLRMGYAVTVPDSAAQALEELRRGRHLLLFCGTDEAYSPLRQYVCRQMPQARRRILYYVLVGPDVHTCYDLQALALSANLVVNERELKYLERILLRGFQDYVKLFHPFLEVLGETRTPVPPRGDDAESSLF